MASWVFELRGKGIVFSPLETPSSQMKKSRQPFKKVKSTQGIEIN